MGGSQSKRLMELMSEVAQSNPKAFEKLARQLHPQLYPFVFRIMGDTMDTQDIVQDTFIRIWENAHKYQPQSTVHTWVFTIAYRLCIDKKRKNKWLSFVPLNVLEQHSQPQEEPIQTEQNKRIQRALNTLALEPRTALVLRHYQGLSCKDIATILNRSVSSVESLIFRAKKQLKSDLFN